MTTRATPETPAWDRRPGSPEITRLAIALRPVQVAYFFPDGDAAAMEAAVARATGCWGGLFHQLVPVSPGGAIDEVADYALRAAPPDLCVIAGGDAAAMPATVERILAGLFPARAIACHTMATTPALLRPLDLLTRGVLRQHWSPAARFWSGNPAEFSFSHGTIADPGAPSWLPALRDGRLDDDALTAYAAVFRLGDLGALESDDRYWSWQDHDTFDSSLLNLTMYGLRAPGAALDRPSPAVAIVVVGDVGSACRFWNLRALRTAASLGRAERGATLAVSVAALGRPAVRDALSTYLAARLTGGREDAGSPEVVFVAMPAASAAVAAMLTSGSGTAAPASVPGGQAILDPQRDIAALLDALPAPVRLAMEEPFPARIEVQLGANVMPYSPPPHFRNPRGMLVARDLQSPLWGRYPRDPAVAPLIVPGAAFRGPALTLGVAQADREGEVDFNVPDERAVLAAYFAARDYVIAPSPAGVAGAAVLDLLGGVAGLAILAVPLVHELLHAIASQNTKKVAQRVSREVAAFTGAEGALARALDALVGPDALLGAPHTFAELRALLQAGGQRAPQLLARFAELVAAGLVLRGYALPCPRCATREWYPLAEAREFLTCPGCGAAFPLPVQSSDGVELPWHYRPNGLVNRVVDLDVLPHLLALQHWATTIPRPSCVVTGLELRRSGAVDADMELDLLFVADGALYAAECKAGAKLAAKDFATARRAADLGVRAFAFATTAPSWEADTAAQIAMLAAESAPDMAVHSWVAAQLLPSRA
jgi:hypothetical protein